MVVMVLQQEPAPKCDLGAKINSSISNHIGFNSPQPDLEKQNTCTRLHMKQLDQSKNSSKVSKKTIPGA
jgi:hypothetical protein